MILMKLSFINIPPFFDNTHAGLKKSEEYQTFDSRN